MKLAVRVALALGVAVMIVLIIRAGGPAILALLAHAGWILLLLVPLHALPIALDVLGWRTLIDRLTASPRFAILFWIAAVREAVNRLLPVASIGGEIVGIQLLAGRGIPGVLASASVVVEVLLTLASQFLFVILGIILMLRATHGTDPVGGLLVGLAIALAAITTLFALLRYGSVFARLERWIERLIGISRGTLPGGENATSRTRGPRDSIGWQRLDATIRELCTATDRLAVTVGWQVTGFVAGSLEVWLALRWLGHPLGFGPSVALESLALAVRQFAFLIPAALGVQEAGFIGFGSFLGLPADVAITLSLVTRMREILFGVPALVSWQWALGWRGLARKT